MTRYEIIKMNEQLFRLLNDNGIDPKDLNYLPMVEAFRKMKSKKHKVNYIVAYLSNKYGITERGIYKIVKRFNGRIKV